MEICSRFTGMERKNGAFLLHTDNADVKVCFVTDEIVRVRASFDHELAEEPYVLMTTAWEDRIKLLPDAALYRSTLIHHTPDSYTKRELVGAGPLHLADARPLCHLQSPLGTALLRKREVIYQLLGGLPGVQVEQLGGEVDGISIGPAAKAVIIGVVQLHAGVAVRMERTAHHAMAVGSHAVHLSHLPNGDGGLDSLIQAQGHFSFVSCVAPESLAWELWCFLLPA